MKARDRLLLFVVTVLIKNMKWGCDPDINKLRKLKKEFKEELDKC